MNPAALVASQTILGYRICRLLVDKGVITKEEAAQVLVQTADDIRLGTEDDPIAAAGEGLAQGYEKAAGWLLGNPAPFGGEGR